MVMRRLLLAAALALAALAANAHPSVSVVFDSRGNLYYSDLAQVWRVAPNGARAVVVPGVHTHELYIDGQDNLYGENLRYDDPRWLHSFWRRAPDGRVQNVVPEHETFKGEVDPSLVRDRAGNHYWAQKPNGPIMKNRTVLARGNFRDIRFMTVTPDGTVYFVDTLDLVRVTPDGRMATIAHGLSTEDWPRGRVHNQIMGLWTDRAGNVYAADLKDRAVKRVTPAGAVSVVAKSPWPWMVSGGGFAPNGDLWLLEFNLINQARVRKITAADRK
jgi:hypothetical protein